MVFKRLIKLSGRHEKKIRLNLAFLIVCTSFSMVVQGGNTSVQDKVISDLAKLQSFEETSLEIAGRPMGEFMSIGIDAACDFDSTVSNIQDVIDTGIAEIRIASNGSYTENLLIDDQSIVIRGGFVDCAAANSNQSTGELIPIDGGLITAPVIRITGMVQRRVVRLENLTLAGSARGGLFLDVPDLELQMQRVLIFGNNALAGSGIRIDNGVGTVQGDIDVFAQDVVIDSNTAGLRAGGIFCVGRADVTFTGMSRISNNTAEDAGGIHMRNLCEISFYSEFLADSFVFDAGIVSNASENDAGGAWITVGAKLYLFGQRMCDGTQCLGSNDQPVVVSNNQADNNNDGNGDGGGLYIEDSGFLSELHANGLIMIANLAGGDGGGAYIGANGAIQIERESGGCWSENRCNFILANRSGSDGGRGGAFYVADESEINLSQAYLEQNRADFGTAIFATGATASVVAEGNVFYNNGDEGSFDFSDFGVISAFNGAAVDVRHSTVVDNNLTSSVFGVGTTGDSSLTLVNSIVHDPSSGNLFGPDNGTLNINCIMAHEGGSFSGSQVSIDDPEFVDRAGGDFHLNPNSPAIDLCQETPLSSPLDIDAEPRGWDDPINNNGSGVYDAGADESFDNDVIFEDGFEN